MAGKTAGTFTAGISGSKTDVVEGSMGNVKTSDAVSMEITGGALTSTDDLKYLKSLRAFTAGKLTADVTAGVTALVSTDATKLDTKSSD